MSQLLAPQQIPAVPISWSDFQPYGELILPSPDGKAFDASDAVLKLDLGIPRFYIRHLTRGGRTFNKITRHNLCTQCLGSLNGKTWLMAVCPPSHTTTPDIDRLKAFRIPGNCFIKLEVGTWHAGPYFDDEAIDFYNLELSDTNIIDHFTYNFAANQSIQFEIVD